MSEKPGKPILDKPSTPQEIRDQARERMKINGLDDTDIKSIREGKMSDAVKIMKANKAWAEANPNSPLAKYLADMRLQNGQMDVQSAEKAVWKIKEMQRKLGVNADGIVGTGTSLAYNQKVEKEDANTEKKDAEKLLADIGSTYTERGIQNLKSGESYRGNDGLIYKKEWDLLTRTSSDDKTRKVSTDGWKTWDSEKGYENKKNIPSALTQLWLTRAALLLNNSETKEGKEGQVNLENGWYFSINGKWFQIAWVTKNAEWKFQITVNPLVPGDTQVFAADYLSGQPIQRFQNKEVLVANLEGKKDPAS